MMLPRSLSMAGWTSTRVEAEGRHPLHSRLKCMLNGERRPLLVEGRAWNTERPLTLHGGISSNEKTNKSK